MRLLTLLPLTLLLLLSQLVGCHKFRYEDSDSWVIPEEVYPYVDLFLDEYELRGGDMQLIPPNVLIELNNKKMSANAVGTCSLSRSTRHLPHITLLRSYWNDSSTTDREILVFHELGHCFLNYSHVPSDNTDIMYPYVLNEIRYRENRDEILDKFFSDSGRPHWLLGMHD